MVRADHRRLQQLQKGIREIASDSWKRALFNELGDVGLELVEEGFEREQDPYGKAWKPITYRKGKILTKTGTLRSSFVKTVTEDGFTITTPVFYGAFHQRGTRFMVRRAFLPYRGVPRPWMVRFRTLAQEHRDRALGGA